MSITNVTDILTRAQYAIGDQDAIKYTAANVRDVLILMAVDRWNEEMFQQYSIAGSGASSTFNPVLEDSDISLFLLFLKLVTAENEKGKADRDSMVITNPAGRTDLAQQSQALANTIEDLRNEIREKRRIRAGYKEETKMGSNTAF